MPFQYIPTNSQLVLRPSSQFYDVFQQSVDCFEDESGSDRV